MVDLSSLPRSPGRSPTNYRDIEGRLIDLIEADALDNYSLLIERERDGYQFEYTKGIRTQGYRYISSSTIKPAVLACCLDQVAKGNVSLDTTAAALVPGWSGAGVQLPMTLHHAASFRSGCTKADCRTSIDDATWLTCVAAMPGNEDALRAPGVDMVYSTGHLDIAGRMAVEAAGLTSWQSLWDAWVAETGLFGGADWGTGLLPSPADQMNITTQEYMSFLRALQRHEILTPALCEAMMADQIADHSGVTPAYAWHGEDWHFAYGLWIESARPAYAVTSPLPRVCSLGAAGQYAAIDRRRGWRIVVSATFAGDFSDSMRFVRTIDHLIDQWAA